MESRRNGKVFILGLTQQGEVFRPSDWAERLAGVMSQFRPKAVPAHLGHLVYSPWCVPSTYNGVKCVIVHPELRECELIAWDFCINFAHDNNLQTRTVLSSPGPMALAA